MFMRRHSVDCVNNGDNYSKLFTLFVCFVHSSVIGGLTRGPATHGLALHLEAVGVVYQAIQNRVGVGGIANLVMPAIQRDLRGDDGRTTAVAVVDDFHQVAPLFGSQLDHRPVIKDQQARASQGFEHTRLAAVQPRHRQLVEQPGGPLVEHETPSRAA